MNVLAFDTCLGAVSAAVRWRGRHGEWLLREAYEARTAGRAERLLPMIAEIMHGAGLAFSALDRIAVTLGPGSFTGVRAGIAAARAFALATGKPVAGTTSLAVMARHARELLGAEHQRRPLVVAVSASGGMIYAQPAGAGAVETGEPQLSTPEAVAPGIGRGPVLVVGSGAAAVAAAVQAAGGAAEALLPDLQPHARALALMAHELPALDRVTPLYLRLPDARPQADKSLARAGS